MSQRSSQRPRLLIALVFASLGFGCNDDPAPTSPTTTTTAPATPPPSGNVTLRIAQLTEDARTVDALLNGAVVFEGIGYPGVSDYVELAAGTYRIQFFPAGSRGTALAETTLTLAAGEIATAVILGFPPFSIQTIGDGSGGPADRGRVRLFNAVPDYPANFDMAVRNGPGLVQSVPFTGASAYAEIVPGIYDLQVLRSGSTEVVAGESGRELRGGTSYTAFAVGTLRRRDVDVFLAVDGGPGP